MRDSFRRVPSANHERRDSDSIIRMDLFPLSSVASAALLSAMDESKITEYRYGKILFNLFAATRCCRDKCQGRKEDRGLGSSLIKTG